MTIWRPHQLALLLAIPALAGFETAEAALEIAEFAASPDEGLTDSDGDCPDWIELRNSGGAVLSTAGYTLSDDRDVADKWALPAIDLQPGGTLIVFASGKARGDAGGELHASFSLASDGGYVGLFEPGGGAAASEFEYPKQFYGLSFGEGGYYAVPTPGESNGEADFVGFVRDTKFSVRRGFFDEPFSVEIRSATEGAEIYYTTDMSVPSPENGELYDGPVAIDTTTLLRAIATKPGLVSSNVDTQSYLFLDDVIRQPAAPAGFPATWGIDNSTSNGSTGRPRPADYEMDPEILDEFGEEAVIAALRNHPTISVVMEQDDLWNESTVAGTGGLYPNPYGGTGNQFLPGWGEPREWEHPCSVEFIGFEKVDGKQVNCGIRIAGNFARHPNRYKHHFRLTSRREYGAAKFRGALFSRSDVDTFDDFILRGGNSESWTFPGSSGNGPGTRANVQYFRDQYYKDMQVAMGHLAPNQEYFHLYLNGLYWGFYTLIERVDAHWMAQHLGGEEDDYDVMKQGNVINDGNREAWEAMYAISRGGVRDEAGYAAIQAYLNIDNLIDYMLFNFWAGTVDWRNNWRGGRRRVDGAGFQFFNWDGERGLGDRGGNRDWTYNSSGTNRMWSYHPNELHHDLRTNPEYRIRFADRVQKHLFNGGVLTEENSAAYYNARADEVKPSLVAESARWGDRQRPNNPYTTNNEWQSMLGYMNQRFFPRRNRIVLSQLRSTDVYPDTAAPEFGQHGGRVAAGYVLEVTSADGEVYLTTDGSDPRLTGGEINPDAVRYDAGVSIDRPTTVRARAIEAGEWSALVEATFITDEPASAENLVISEIFYNPVGATEEREFIELLNISGARISLAGVRFDAGIGYQFSDPATLDPGARVVLTPAEYEGQLANGGENLSLRASDGGVIRQFRYDDRAPWPGAADGKGRSLVLASPGSNPDHGLAASWLPSAADGGTPGEVGMRAPEAGDDLKAFFFGGRPLEVELEDGVASVRVPRVLDAGGGVVTLEVSDGLGGWEPGGVYEGFEGGAMVWSLPGASGAFFVRARVTLAGE